jgi:alpha-glucosidase
VRGVPFIYYGEEIGMKAHEIPLDRGLDPVAARYRFVPQVVARWLRRHGILLNRDECRLPMQWHHGKNAGFSRDDATPWLPVHPEAPSINVAAQHGDPGSLLNTYRRLLALRRQRRALHRGRLELVADRRLPNDVVAYRRVHEDEAVDVFLNFSDRTVKLDLGEPRGRSLVSSRHGEARAAAPAQALAPYEGVLLLDPA